MKNTFGESIAVTLFGESHGEAVGVVIDGLAPGIEVDRAEIDNQLSRRRPSSPLDTARRESDNYRIISGEFNGKTTGTPLTVIIPNENTRSRDYTYGLARPSHADYTAYLKYHGYEDYRGGGHFSGRVTAALCAAGGIMIPALRKMGVKIGTHILRCGGISDRPFENTEGDIDYLSRSAFPVLDEKSGEKMAERIMKAKEDGDSVGGVTQTAIYGAPEGLGEPWFDSIESEISHIVFSLGGIKGVDFGMGFDFADATGSACNDAMRYENGKVITLTNNNGGINGGITNGAPIVFRCAVKPTASIAKPQKTVDFTKGENAEITIGGRHDPAIIRRICPVLDSVSAIAMCDIIARRFGTDIFTKGILS